MAMSPSMADSDPRGVDSGGDAIKDASTTSAVVLPKHGDGCPTNADDREQPSDRQASHDDCWPDTDDEFDDRPPRATPAYSDDGEQPSYDQASDRFNDGPEVRDSGEKDVSWPDTDDEFDDRPPRSTTSSSFPVISGCSESAGHVEVSTVAPKNHDPHSGMHTGGDVHEWSEQGTTRSDLAASLPSLQSLASVPPSPLARRCEPKDMPAGQGCTLTTNFQQGQVTLDPRNQGQEVRDYLGTNNKYVRPSLLSKPRPSTSLTPYGQPSQPRTHSDHAVGLFDDVAGTTPVPRSPSGAWEGVERGAPVAGTPPPTGLGDKCSSQQPQRPMVHKYGGQRMIPVGGDGREHLCAQRQLAPVGRGTDSGRAVDTASPGVPGGSDAGMVPSRSPVHRPQLLPGRMANGRAGRSLPRCKNGQAVTTLIIINVHAEVSAKEWMSLIDRTGFAQCYDYFYAPSDFNSGTHQGKAFINFKSRENAEAFFMEWNAAKLVLGDHSRTLRVTASNVQGFQANANSWTTSRLRRVKNSSLRPFIAGARR